MRVWKGVMRAEIWRKWGIWNQYQQLSNRYSKTNKSTKPPSFLPQTHSSLAQATTMRGTSSSPVWVWSFPSLRQTRTRLSSSSYAVQRPSPCSGSQDLLSTFQRSRTRQYDNQRTMSDARTIFIASFMTKSGFALSSAIFSFTKTLYAEGGLFSFATPCSAYMHFKKSGKI